MPKALKILVLIVLIVSPVIFYKTLNKQNIHSNDDSSSANSSYLGLPKIALIFDDLGESLSDLKDLYALKIPLTISIIPNLKFSRNIAYIGDRCGFSIFIHLPCEPENQVNTDSLSYEFISSNLSKKKTESLLRRYLNSIRIAIGVNNHMGSKVTQDRFQMGLVVSAIKKRGLIFVDSRTSLDSVAYDVASQQGLRCGYNEGFLDAVDKPEEIKKRMDSLIAKAEAKGKIIVIAHPRSNTINFLKDNLLEIKKNIEFVTIEDYFEL